MFSNFLISYDDSYDLLSFNNKYIYIDNINVILENFKKIMLLKVINLSNILICYVYDNKETIVFELSNEIVFSIYLNNIILIVTKFNILQVDIINKLYNNNEIIKNDNINISNITKFINFDKNNLEIIPNIEINLDIIELDDYTNNYKNIKLQKYKNKSITCYLDTEILKIINFCLFEKSFTIKHNNISTSISIDYEIYDIIIINNDYFLIITDSVFYIINSKTYEKHELFTCIDIIEYITYNIIVDNF
jgi:hypothetical protein